MQPISMNNPNVHRGPSSSAEFNKIRNDIHKDLVSLFDIANHHDDEIKRNMDVLIRENFFMQNRVIELEKKVQEIEQDLLYKQEGSSKQRMIKSFYSIDGLSDGDPAKEAYINTMYGYMTIPHSDSVSKTSYTSDVGSVIIPESLEVSVFESNNTRPIDSTTGMREYYSIEDHNINLALDRDKNTYWVRTTSFPEDSGVSEVYGIMHIKLPLDVLTDVYANVVKLNPFPEYSLKIRDIQYKGYGEQWYRLPNYPTTKGDSGEEVPVELEGSGKLIFSFPKTEITEIQILFTQPYWFRNENSRDFVYGFQEIAVEHEIHNNTIAEFVSEFSLEGTTKSFSVIEEPIVSAVKGSDQAINDLVEHKLYYNKNLTNEFSFGTEIVADIQKIYVRTTIKGQGNTTPMLRSIALDYTFKDIYQS